MFLDAVKSKENGAVAWLYHNMAEKQKRKQQPAGEEVGHVEKRGKRKTSEEVTDSGNNQLSQVFLKKPECTLWRKSLILLKDLFTSH